MPFLYADPNFWSLFSHSSFNILRDRSVSSEFLKHSFCFYLFGMDLYLYIWNRILLSIEFIVDVLLCFSQNFKYFTIFSLCLHRIWQKICIILILVLFNLRCFSLCLVFKIFSVFVAYSLSMICLDVVLLFVLVFSCLLLF